MSSQARFRQMPTTTTITKLPSGKPRIANRNVISQRRQTLNADQAKDPQQVAQTIRLLQEDIRSASESLRNEPMLGAIIFIAIPVQNGVTFTLTHNFGRPFQGYFVTRTYGTASAPITLRDSTLPAGVSNLTTVALISPNSGTCDIRVW